VKDNNVNLILAINRASNTTSKSHILKKEVLVVDDDARVLNFIMLKLILKGFGVITATSGEEALNLVSSRKPDVVLLDIVMYPMNGLEVLKRLRAGHRPPVIAMSAHTSAAREALSLGANDFISKPFHPDELVERIKNLLHGA
jgi:DNA-binding response OmpR family regulator